jgi:hypothetical protein
MAIIKKIRRVQFREAINPPGDGVIIKRSDGRNEQRIINGSTENVFPTRGAIGGKPDYNLSFCDGWVFVEHPQSRIKVRCPVSMVREVVFDEDVPGSGP